MSLAKRTCATCCAFEPVRGCWAVVSAIQQRDPHGGCKHHQTTLESDARDDAVLTRCQALLIQSHSPGGSTDQGPP
ncbi:hypothetical protein POHY109586_22095 [Polaromonas hydrogenivorans]